jgi:hypothetical protein
MTWLAMAVLARARMKEERRKEGRKEGLLGVGREGKRVYVTRGG